MIGGKSPWVRRSGWLLVRRHGSLWGVPHSALRELVGGRPPCLELESGATLVADELLNLTADLEARPFPRCAERFYPEKIHGLAVWREQPVILLEPGTPPACLSFDPARVDLENAEMETHGDETRRPK